MKRYKFIKDRTASPKEVFENLKNGGLKLLCFNQVAGLWSQVAWCGDNTIEVITINGNGNKVIGQYFMSFPYPNVEYLKANTNFFKNKTWWLGYVED